MKENNSGCLICGEEIVYLSTPEELTCHYCNTTNQAAVRCKADHYICDSCHQTKPNDFIEKFCYETNLLDPWEISVKLMENKMVKMHGPEHHFLVPAALLAAYYNNTGHATEKTKKISIWINIRSLLHGFMI